MDQAPSYRQSQLHYHGILLALFPPLLFDQANPLDSMTGADIRGSHSTFSTTAKSTPFKMYLMESWQANEAKGPLEAIVQSH
jgi:hypothetical protein